MTGSLRWLLVLGATLVGSWAAFTGGCSSQSTASSTGPVQTHVGDAEIAKLFPTGACVEVPAGPNTSIPVQLQLTNVYLRPPNFCLPNTLNTGIESFPCGRIEATIVKGATPPACDATDAPAGVTWYKQFGTSPTVDLYVSSIPGAVTSPPTELSIRLRVVDAAGNPIAANEAHPTTGSPNLLCVTLTVAPQLGSCSDAGGTGGASASSSSSGGTGGAGGATTSSSSGGTGGAGGAGGATTSSSGAGGATTSSSSGAGGAGGAATTSSSTTSSSGATTSSSTTSSSGATSSGAGGAGGATTSSSSAASSGGGAGGAGTTTSSGGAGGLDGGP